MSKNIFTCLLAVALFCLVQDSVYASPRYGQQMQMSNNKFADNNDLIQALENLYIENQLQFLDIGLTIKQGLLERINDWEIDRDTTKYVVQKLDENLSGQQGRVGDVWRRVRSMIVSGLASKLLRGVDLKQAVKNIMAKIDLDQIIRFIPTGS